MQYLTQIQFLKQNLKIGYLYLDSIKDTAIYLQLLDWMNQNGFILRTYDLQRKKKIEVLQRKVKHFDTDMNLVSATETIRLDKIVSAEVTKLVSFLFSQDKPRTKEEIFEHIYNICYDPIIHDNKIYKLILKTKKMIAQDFLINHYGEYSVNRKKYRLVQS